MSDKGLPASNPADRAAQLAAAQNALGRAPKSKRHAPKKPSAPAPVQSVDDASLAKAKADAARTGTPQPVRARDGHVVYYVDYDGGVVPDEVAKDRLRQADEATGGHTPFVPSDQSTKDRGTGKLQQAQALADANLPSARAAASAVADANAQLGYVWVDGKQMKITGVNKDGSYNATIGASKSHPMSDFLGTTAFGALDSSQIDPSTRFTMAYGQGDIFTGKTSAIPMMGPNYGGGDNTAAAANPASGGEYSALSNQVGNTTNMMTVGQGMTWLVNLSIEHADLYQAMVDHLHDAGYLSDSQYGASGGKYNSLVGQAFAQAASDTSVINAQPNGMHMSLYDYLAERGAANKAAQASQYKPVPRDYLDPAALEGAARSVAQSDLGRDLTADEVAQLVSHFHGLQSQMYDQVDAAGRKGQNATVTTPNAAGQVDSFIHDGANAQEAANFRVAQYGQALHQLFTGGRL